MMYPINTIVMSVRHSRFFFLVGHQLCAGYLAEYDVPDRHYCDECQAFQAVSSHFLFWGTSYAQDTWLKMMCPITTIVVSVRHYRFFLEFFLGHQLFAGYFAEYDVPDRHY